MILDIVKTDERIMKLMPGASTHVLRQICKDVKTFNQDLHDLTQNLVETMFAANGVGLAAPQVGVPLSIFVMRTAQGIELDTKEVHILINPTAAMSGETYKDMEGCLSIPGLLGRVQRYKQLACACQDTEGKPQVNTLDGLAARIFQHELDHLSGVLFVDRADKFYRPVDPIGACEFRPANHGEIADQPST